MAKKEIRKDGKLTKYAQRKYTSLARHTEIDREINRPQPRARRDGIRSRVIAVYHDKGLLAAYQVLKIYNKKFGKDIYTREVFEAWIEEENRKNKGQEKDDGFDR